MSKFLPLAHLRKIEKEAQFQLPHKHGIDKGRGLEVVQGRERDGVVCKDHCILVLVGLDISNWACKKGLRFSVCGNLYGAGP